MINKKVYKLLTITLLTLCIGQVSYPLLYKTTEYLANEFNSIVPDTIYTKTDLINSKEGTIYKDTIKNEEHKTLLYEIKFKVFTDSEAIVTINKDKYNLEDYSGKTIKGETQNKIKYFVNAINITEDVIDYLEVREELDENVDEISENKEDKGENDKEEKSDKKDVVEKDKGEVEKDKGEVEKDKSEVEKGEDKKKETSNSKDQTVEEREKIGSSREIASKEPGKTTDIAPNFPHADGTADKMGATTTDTKYNITSDGGESGKGELAVVANDTVVVYRNKNFDGCGPTGEHDSGDSTGIGSHDAGIEEYPGSVEVPEFKCAFNKQTSIRTAPNPNSRNYVKNMIDYMNIQARTDKGTSIELNSSNVSIDSNYTKEEYNKFNMRLNEGIEAGTPLANTKGTRDNFAIDSSSHLSPLAEKGINTYDFDITVTDGGSSQTVHSSMTVVDPFYINESDYFANKTVGLKAEHMYGNQWRAKEVDSLISAGISLDMVLDVQYDQTVGNTKEDDSDVTNEWGQQGGVAVDALTKVGE